MIWNVTRSTRRAQTSVAEATWDHYAHIFQCNNVEPWWWKAKPKGLGSLPAPRSGYATNIMVFSCSFTQLGIPRSPPKFNQFFIVLPRTPHTQLHVIQHRVNWVYVKPESLPNAGKKRSAFRSYLCCFCQWYTHIICTHWCIRSLPDSKTYWILSSTMPDFNYTWIYCFHIITSLHIIALS